LLILEEDEVEELLVEEEAVEGKLRRKGNVNSIWCDPSDDIDALCCE